MHVGEGNEQFPVLKINILGGLKEFGGTKGCFVPSNFWSPQFTKHWFPQTSLFSYKTDY